MKMTDWHLETEKIFTINLKRNRKQYYRNQRSHWVKDDFSVCNELTKPILMKEAVNRMLFHLLHDVIYIPKASDTNPFISIIVKNVFVLVFFFHVQKFEPVLGERKALI